MSLKTTAILAIIFIGLGFLLFLFGLFSQTYDFLPAIISFTIGIVLYFVARRLSLLKKDHI